MTHLLVTNDFPPKTGGIQSYLFELWRRLPPGEFAILTTAYPGSGRFDDEQAFRVERVDRRVLLPGRALLEVIESAALSIGAGLVVLDPALPLGLIGRRCSVPYAVVLHGAEVTVPGRLPVTGTLLTRVLSGARLLIAAGGYPAAEAERALRASPTPRPPVVVVPPGVDAARFVPRSASERAEIRQRYGVAPDAVLVVSVSRLVPRKGMDVLIAAAARCAPEHPELVVLISGRGRDAPRLEAQIARLGAPVRLLGWTSEEELPGLYGAADVVAMLCRSRWVGLEQEGFGIVFLEAAACAVPQLAGRSGGSAEAVLDGETGLVVDTPADVDAVTAALRRLLDDEALRRRLGSAARERATAVFGYEALAARLHTAIGQAGG